MARANQYVRTLTAHTYTYRHLQPGFSNSSGLFKHRLSSRRSRLYIMTRRVYHQTKSSQRWARTVRIPTPFLRSLSLTVRYSCLYLSPLHTAGKIALPSAVLQFWDLGGQRGIRSIWPKYYDDCHAVVYVVDAVDHERLSEGWEVFGTLSFPFHSLNAKKARLRLNANANANVDSRFRPLCSADPRRPPTPFGEQAGQPQFALSRRNSA
jgi:ADP-ribosylation factor family